MLKVYRVFKDNKVAKGFKDYKESRVLKEFKDHKEQVLKVSKDHRVFRDLKVK